MLDQSALVVGQPVEGKVVDGIRLVSFEIRADMQTPVVEADNEKS